MRKSIIISALLALITITSVRADEGMWLPMLIERLNQRDLQKMGLQLTPEEIYSVNNSSLKDAIVSMGGFCTGEIISPNGLMLTNHHYGFDAIRENSTV
ncbi:MAG TPA: S46 family peptidase, partial [Cryomorphaceae bacterium]|nr:S46 family peptidase [Cryomorphaceae bacterium]